MSFANHLQELEKQVVSIDKDGHYPKDWLVTFAKKYQGFDVENHYHNKGLYELLIKQAQVAKVCLNTSFCAWCHSACMWYLINSNNQSLKDNYLPKLKNGEILAGTGLSNAMKSIENMDDIRINADLLSDGYLLNGALPWVSNISENSVFAVVFKYKNGLKMGLIDVNNEGVAVSEASNFIALDGSKTVNVRLTNYALTHTMLISDNANKFLSKIKSGFILLQTQMALGVVSSTIELIKSKFHNKPWLINTLPSSLENITQRYEDLSRNIFTVCEDFNTDNESVFEKIIDIRLEASMLSLESNRSLSLAYGAAGYLQSSIAYRKNREAQFVSIVTPSVTHLNLIKQNFLGKRLNQA